MKITEIKVSPVLGQQCLKAYVTLTLDAQLVIHNIRIVEIDGKLVLSMPNKKMSDGSYKDFVHPINRDFREELTHAIINKYNEVLKEQ